VARGLQKQLFSWGEDNKIVKQPLKGVKPSGFEDYWKRTRFDAISVARCNTGGTVGWM
jgi:hypothetical protein